LLLPLGWPGHSEGTHVVGPPVKGHVVLQRGGGRLIKRSPEHDEVAQLKNKIKAC